MEKSEIRKDYFLDKYVIIAPKRARRPQRVEKVESPASECHFCPQNLAPDEIITYEHKNSDGNWDILSVVNKYSAVSFDNPRSYGQQEVIIEGREHNHELYEYSPAHIVNIIDACISRFRDLKAKPKVKHVIIFKNEGGKAGASVSHSHTQIMALPLVPPKVEEEACAFNRYRLENVSCPYCDIVADEQKKATRTIYEDDNLYVLAPYASDSPYGAWFIPKRHIGSITDLNHAEKLSLALALKPMLRMLDDFGISYNFFYENAINDEDYHTHLKLAPRPNIWAGLELGTGVIINSIPPEDAARMYRMAITKEPKK